MIRAADQLVEQGIAEPRLIGDADQIESTRRSSGWNSTPSSSIPRQPTWPTTPTGCTSSASGRASHAARPTNSCGDSNYFASVMVEVGDADAMLTGLTHHYPSALRPPLQIIGTADDADYAAGVYMLTFKNRVVFCADTTVNLDPDEEVLAEITKHTADLARRFNVEPRAALLSYSNFGSVTNEGTRKLRRRGSRLQDDPEVDFPVDGEMQADTALVEDILQDTYDFAELDDPANVLVFPNLEAGNIGYKLLQRLGGAEAIGPMLVGMDKPVHVLQRGDEVKDIVNLAGVAVVDAQQE